MENIGRTLQLGWKIYDADPVWRFTATVFGWARGTRTRQSAKKTRLPRLHRWENLCENI